MNQHVDKAMELRNEMPMVNTALRLSCAFTQMNLA